MTTEKAEVMRDWLHSKADVRAKGTDQSVFPVR